MKIALLGWYFQNNAGDDRILECVTKKLNTLGFSDISVFVAWEDLQNKTAAINQCDFLIIGGGGLILRNTNRVAILLQSIKIPFGLLGVSVDSVGFDNHIFIDYLAGKAKFIVVRDSFSYEVFKPFDCRNLHLAPDLTFLYPYQSTEETSILSSIALSLRPWRSNLFKQYSKNYHRFNKLSHKMPWLPKLLGLWDAASFVAKLKKSTNQSIHAFPLHFCEEGCDNQLLAKFLDEALSKEFDIKILSSSNLLVGMRLHSLIFATQLGIPFIALSYASKINHYLRDLGLEQYALNVNNFKKLPEKLQLVFTHHSEINMRLKEVTKEYEKEIHQVVDDVLTPIIS